MHEGSTAARRKGAWCQVGDAVSDHTALLSVHGVRDHAVTIEESHHRAGEVCPERYLLAFRGWAGQDGQIHPRRHRAGRKNAEMELVGSLRKQEQGGALHGGRRIRHDIEETVGSIPGQVTQGGDSLRVRDDSQSSRLDPGETGAGQGSRKGHGNGTQRAAAFVADADGKRGVARLTGISDCLPVAAHDFDARRPCLGSRRNAPDPQYDENSRHGDVHYSDEYAIVSVHLNMMDSNKY